MPKAKSQENKENAGADTKGKEAAEAYKLEAGKEDDDSGDDDSDEESEEGEEGKDKQPVSSCSGSLDDACDERFSSGLDSFSVSLLVGRAPR